MCKGNENYANGEVFVIELLNNNEMSVKDVNKIMFVKMYEIELEMWNNGFEKAETSFFGRKKVL